MIRKRPNCSPALFARLGNLADKLPAIKKFFATGYSVFFPSAFAFAHLALAIAASLAFTAGLARRSAFLAAFGLA